MVRSSQYDNATKQFSFSYDQYLDLGIGDREAFSWSFKNKQYEVVILAGERKDEALQRISFELQEDEP